MTNRHSQRDCFNVGAIVCPLILIAYTNLSLALTFSPEIEAGEYFTDNVFLTTSKKSDWVTQIIPRVSLDHSTSKSHLAMTYQLQVLKSTQQSAQDRTYHQGSLQVDTKHDHAALEVASVYTQDITTPTSSGITPNNIVGQRRPDVLTTAATPKVFFPIRNFADVVMTWRYGQVNYYHNDNNNQPVTHDQRGTLELTSGTMFSDVSWFWKSSYQESRQNGQLNSKIQQTQFTSYVRVSPKFSLILSVGSEENLGTVLQSLKGESWSVGGQWTPSRHSRLQVQAGHRPFGQSYVLNAIWQRKSTLLTANYSETVTTDAQARLDSLPQSLSPISTNRFAQFFPQVNNLLFVNRTLEADWQYQYRKSTFNVSAFRQRREYVQLPLHENGKGFNLGWTYQLNRRVQSEIGYGKAYQEFLTGQTNPWWQLQASLNWMLGKHLNLQLTAEHFDSKPSGFSVLSENSVAFNFVYRA